MPKDRNPVDEATESATDAPPEDDFDVPYVIQSASGFGSTPEELHGALHRAKLLEGRVTRTQVQGALLAWRTPNKE